MANNELSSVSHSTCFEESCGTAVEAASALHCSLEARLCVDIHAGLHGASSERKAVVCESLGVLRGRLYNCSGGRVGSPLSSRCKSLRHSAKSIDLITSPPNKKRRKCKKNNTITKDHSCSNYRPKVYLSPKTCGLCKGMY